MPLGIIITTSQKSAFASLIQFDFLQQQQQSKSQSPWDVSEAIIES